MKRKEKIVVAKIIFLGFLFLFFVTMWNQTKQKWEFAGYEEVTILPGDTVWGIAEEFKVEERKTMDYAKEIMKLNQMTSDKIKEGEKIIVPLYH